MRRSGDPVVSRPRFLIAPQNRPAYNKTMVRRESCAIPTGGSPLRVSAEAPGSRVRS
jgi:hypothetical protein